MIKPDCTTAWRRRARAAGFTLLEILITLFVMAIGLLGTASLQAFALKMSHAGQLRSQAVILGVDLMERIEANNPAAVRLYRAAGFTEYGYEPRALRIGDAYVDEHLMARPIPQAAATVG